MSASTKTGDRLIAAAQAAGVVATGWFVWTHHILPRLSIQPLAGILTEALLYVMVAWMCGAAITFCVYFAVSLAELPVATRLSLRASAPAMWFAPAIVLLSTKFPAAFAVSLLLVANATRQMISQWGVVESPAQPEPAGRGFMFWSASPASAFSWGSASVLVASAAAQAGTVALLWRRPFLAAALLALSTAILTSLSISSGAQRPGNGPALPHSALSVVMTFLLAATLTFGGIQVRGRGFGGSEEATGPAGGGGKSAAPAAPDVAAPQDDNLGFGGDFPGVILLPELKPYTTLYVPAPVLPVRFGAPLAKPVGIPFSGDYWMYRWPAARPPRSSIIRRGSATDLSFHTTDGWPMEMEAHQKLETPMSLQCCSQIQVMIRNADQYPGTVSLELILMDTSKPGPGLILDTLPVRGDVLNFFIPRDATLRQFDELKVIFRRDRIRADKSARIAIERFIMAP